MTFESVVLGKSPRRFYHFDDAAGSSNNPVDVVTGSNASASTAGGVTRGVAGVVGTAYQCDGVDDKVELANIAGSVFGAGAGVVGFYKTNGTALPKSHWIWRDNSATGGWLLYYASSGDLTMRVAGTDHKVTLPAGFDPQAWYLFALMVGPTTGTFYLGNPTTGALTVTTWSQTVSALWVGYIRLAQNGGLAQYSAGSFDEWSTYYSQPVLTQSDVQDILNAAAPAPGVPTSVVGTVVSSTSLRLAWSAPSSGGTLTGYEVRIGGGTPVAATSPHTFTGLTPATAYTMEVRTVGPGGTSAWVGATATTATPPNVPEAVTATPTRTTITLAWSAPSTGPAPEGYEVRIDGGAVIDAALALSHAFTGLGSGTTHTVEVRSYTTAGDSAWVALTVSTVAALPRTHGTHVWAYPDLADVAAEEYAVDFSCLVDEVKVTHGRADTTSQPDASAATVEFTTSHEDDPAVWEVVDIGAVFRVVHILSDATVVDRFLGRVTDLTMAWDDIGTETPNFGIGQLVATGLLADLGRRVVGLTDYPQELDGARVARVCTDAGTPMAALLADPGTVDVVARPAASADALSVAHDAAESTGGLVWQTRAGDLAYADAEHRRGATIELTLDACDLLVTPQWRRDLSGLVNDVSVGYGTGSAHYTATDTTSIGHFGLYAHTYDTELAELADATAMGNLLLLRNSSPVWMLSALPVDTKGLADDHYAALLDLDVGSLIELTGLPAIGTAPTSMAAWVEGWTERWAYGTHEVEVTVSDYCRTAPPVAWDEVDTETTWDTYGDGTWDQASCGGYHPLPTLGRWIDVPASVRWDGVPTTTTWDTWEVP